MYGQPSRRDTSAKYGDRNEELALEFAQRTLKAGVTTLVDSYGVLPPSIIVRDKINQGGAVGSRLLLAGNILGWGGPFSITFSLTKDADLSLFQEKWDDLLAQGMGEELTDMTPDELRVAMNGYLDKGVDVVKYGGTSHFMRPSLIGFSPRQQAVIVAETHKRGKPVQTHATSSEGLRLAVEAGIDLIQHPEMMSRDLPDDLDPADRVEGHILRHAREFDHRRYPPPPSCGARRCASANREAACRDHDGGAVAQVRHAAGDSGYPVSECAAPDCGGMQGDPGNG